MAAYKVFWPEIFRIWAQWLGIGLAAIPAGILLGILERNGVHSRVALAVSLAVGFVLAFTLWVLIGQRFKAEPEVYAMGISSNVISIDEGREQSIAIAAAIVCCISLASLQPPGAGHVVMNFPTVHDAIPKL